MRIFLQDRKNIFTYVESQFNTVLLLLEFIIINLWFRANLVFIRRWNMTSNRPIFTICVVSFLLNFACKREFVSDLDRALDTKYVINYLSPNLNRVQSDNQLTLSFQLVPDDSVGFTQLLVGKSQPSYSLGTYSITLNIDTIQNLSRFSIPLSFFFKTTRTRQDSLHFVKFSLKKSLDSYQMLTPRSNHASILLPNNRIISSGGVASFSDTALSTIEYFSPETGISTSLPSNSTYGRAGHGLYYHEFSEMLFLVGGGNRHYSNDATRKSTPIERLSTLNGNIKSFSFQIPGQDFAWVGQDNLFWVQGGLIGEMYQSRLFGFQAQSDTLKLLYNNGSGIQLAEHTLTSVSPSELFLFGSTFGGSFNSHFSVYFFKKTGGVSYSPILPQKLRNEHAIALLTNDFLLVSGGYHYLNLQGLIENSFELIDLQKNKSYLIPTTLTSERASHTMIKIDHNIFVLGGYNQQQTVLSTIEHFIIEE